MSIKAITLIDTYRDSVANGRVLDNLAQHYKSVVAPGQQMTAKQYGIILRGLGRAANLGDVYMYAIHSALTTVSPYLTVNQAMYNIASTFHRFTQIGWKDVRSATGPEAGAPSGDDKQVTLQEAIGLTLILKELEFVLPTPSTPGLGWALYAVTRKDAPQLLQTAYLPHIYAWNKKQA